MKSACVGVLSITNYKFATITPSVQASTLQQNQAHKSKLSEETVHKQKFTLHNITASALTLFYQVIQLRQDNISLTMTTVCKPSATSLYSEMFTGHNSSSTEETLQSCILDSLN